MKTTRRLLAIVVAFVLAVPMVFAQNVSLSTQNVTVKDAIAALNKASGYSVVINSEDIDLNRKVSVNADNTPIQNVLDQIFSGQNVVYVFNGRSISVTGKVAAQNTQSRSIAGIVTDSAGEPLVGATIMVKGSRNGAIADYNGKFLLQDTKFPATLVISFIGFADTEYAVKGDEKELVIVMNDSMNLLNDVVVVGYGTQKKVNLTGAVAVVDGKEINQRPVSTTAQALQGADPSLVFSPTNGSIEGSQYSLTIRGATSVSSSSVSPLVLVDGIESSLTLVNPNDIESISILKDASACAIYGAKASAGVILITTKSGAEEEGKAHVSYQGRFSMSDNTTSTDFITTAYDYVTLTNSFNQLYQGNDAWTFTPEQIQMMYERRNDKTENPSRPWVVPDATGTNTYLYLGNFDWYKYFYKTIRPETEHNLSVSGGNSKINYYASARYLYREGIFNQAASDYLNNVSFRAKLNAKVTKWLDYSVNVSFEHQSYDYGGFWEQDGTTGLVDVGILYNTTQNVGPFYVPYNPDGTVNMVPGYMFGATSPLCSGRAGVWMTQDNNNSRKKNALTVTNRLTFNIYKGLKLIADYSYRRNDNVSMYRCLPTANCYDNANKRMYVGNGLTGGYFSNGSVYDFYQEERYYRDGHVFNAYAQYDGKFGKNSVAATLGANLDDYSSSKLTVKQKGSLSETLSYLDLASATEIQTLKETGTSYRTLGFFGRVNYGYDDRYLVEVSGRYDGTSRFPKGNRWGFFPSASLGWRMSEEAFWTPIKNWWNKSKLRLSYGTLGNQQVSDYYYFDTINLAKLSYTFDGQNVAQSAYASNPVSSSLTWETVVTYNVGLDLGFFKDRLNISADAYVRDTKNMLTAGMTLTNVYGSSAPKENAADLRTTGFELSVTWHDSFMLGSQPFHYSLTGTLGDNVSKITRYNNPTKLLTDYYEGMTLGEIWGYHAIGLFDSDEAAANWANTYDLSVVNKSELACKAPYNHVMSGDLQYENLDGDKYMKGDKIAINNGSNTANDPGDRRIIGNSLPRYRYAFKFDFSWNNIDLAIFFQGVGKCDWVPDSKCVYFWGPYSYRRPTFIASDLPGRCWSETNTSGYFPRQRAQLATLGMPTNDYFIQDASYLRLKNLSIGYSIPFKTKAISKFRVYLNGENLFYLSPMKKVTTTIDPEVATSGAYGDCLYPFSRTFTVGLDITF